MKTIKRSLGFLIIVAILVSTLSVGTFAAESSEYFQDNGYWYTVTNGEATVTSYYGTSANVIIPNTLGGYPLTSIGDGAFSEAGAYDGVQVTSISISKGIRSIGENALIMCPKLTSITVSSENVFYTSIDGVLYNKTLTVLVACPTAKTSVRIPAGITTIAAYAFMTSELTNIILPEGVTSVGKHACEGCFFLSSITVPSSVTSIGEDAFSACDKLTLYGLSGSYIQTYASAKKIPFVVISVSKTATPTKSAVLVNGSSVAFQAYNIDGNNYFKLRDLAKVLSGTAKQVEVSWDAANNAINMTSGKAYTSVGGELAVSGDTVNKAATLTTSKVYLNGSEITVTAYNIGGNNYFKLRDVAAAINFGVTWNGTTNTIGIDTSTGYTA